MMKLISAWFEPVSVPQRYDSPSRVLLWLILLTGAWLRFWGLGNVGLHGDEETMAMTAMAVLKHGGPYLPSGMFYARAPLHTYMMAGSAWLFGESEWSFRFPSAVVGSLTGLAAFFMGRRFLPPAFNLAFVATMTFLPVMIELSQTARMYIFWLTCVMMFVACIFRWESDQRLASLLMAMLIWLLGLQFHTLSIFVAPLFLYPGLSRQSWRQVAHGAVAFAVAFLIFSVFNDWIGAHYPHGVDRPDSVGRIARIPGLAAMLSSQRQLIVTSILVVGTSLAFLLFRITRSGNWRMAPPVLLVGLGVLAISVLQYHVGTVLVLFGIVFWMRTPGLPRRWLVASLVAVAVLAAIHITVLHHSALYPGRKLIGALVGQPGIWPILRFLELSPAAAVVFGVWLAVSLFRFARRRPLRVDFLFFTIAVWCPLIIMGFFSWYIEPRYTIGQLPSFLVCAFAALAFLSQDYGSAETGTVRPSTIGLLVILTLVAVNPVALARTAHPSYGMYPDHKGAADYIKSLKLGPDAILVAEDVLQQTYYLGKVNYWLRQVDDAQNFCVVKGGQVVDQYTATPVLGTGTELTALLDRNKAQQLFVIGSGEDFVGNTREFRGRGIQEVLDSDRFQVVYNGRDGKTKVWKLVH